MKDQVQILLRLCVCLCDLKARAWPPSTILNPILTFLKPSSLYPSFEWREVCSAFSQTFVKIAITRKEYYAAVESPATK